MPPLGLSWVPRYCSTSLIESSNREPVLWVAFTPLATSWQTSKRFMPCASARCIFSERITDSGQRCDCFVGYFSSSVAEGMHVPSTHSEMTQDAEDKYTVFTYCTLEMPRVPLTKRAQVAPAPLSPPLNPC